jgi:spore coat protein CotH
MEQNFTPVVSMKIWALSFLLLLSPRARGGAVRPLPASELFSNGPIMQISVEIGKSGMESLRQDHRKQVRAVIQQGGTTYRDVAAHIKGAAGSLRDIDDRPALTLVFNWFEPGQRFHGLSRIHLNNSVQDPSYLEEAICGEICRASGVPAARATPVMVSLNGKKLGFYVLKEGFSKEFLKEFFKHSDGNLYDGGFCTDIGTSTHKSSGRGPDDHSDLKTLIAATRESDPLKRWDRLQSVLDVDRFISFMVVETLVLHWDGYSQKANNYRVYFNPDDRKFVFFAHGMDQMFGRGGSVQYSVIPEMGGSVAQAIISTSQGLAQYKRRLKEVQSRYFQADPLVKRVHELAAPVRRAMALEPERLREYDSEIEGLQQRIVERCRDVEKQLKTLP